MPLLERQSMGVRSWVEPVKFIDIDKDKNEIVDLSENRLIKNLL